MSLMKYELNPDFTVRFARGQVVEVRYFSAIVLAGIAHGRLQV